MSLLFFSAERTVLKTPKSKKKKITSKKAVTERLYGEYTCIQSEWRLTVKSEEVFEVITELLFPDEETFN